MPFPLCDILEGPEDPSTCPGDDAGKPCGCPPLGGDIATQLVAPGGGLPGGSAVLPKIGGENMPVDLATGLADVSISALGNGGMGPGVNMRWSNAMTDGATLKQFQTSVGLSWFLDLNARMVNLGNDRWMAFFLPTGRGSKYYFKLNTSSGEYEPELDCNAELDLDSGTFYLTIDGQQFEFDEDTGKIEKMIAGSGIVTDFIYDPTTKLLDEVLTKRVDGATHVHNSLKLAYQSSGGGDRLETITERSYVGTDPSPVANDYTEMERIELEIPGSQVADRCPASQLYKVHIQTPNSSGTNWTTDSTQMFIYELPAPQAPANPLTGVIKYVIENSAYQSMVDPDDTALNDSNFADLASVAYGYDTSSRLVTSVSKYGGDLTCSVTYSENPDAPTDPHNNWFRKAVYTSPDGATKTVYSNHCGRDMLVVENDGTDEWIYHTKFDGEGRVIEQYSPASIDMSPPMSLPTYDESELDLAVQIKASEGRVDLTAYNANGRIESRSVRKGATETPIKISEIAYTSRQITSGGGTRTIYPVTSTKIYRSDSGAGSPVSTSYGYTWDHTGTLLPSKVTTTLPTVPSGQNGHITNAETIEFDIDEFGRITKSKDARGVFTEYSEYDEATGIPTQIIRDSGTGTLNLTTDREVNVRGRVVKTLGPVHDVDGNSIRTINWDIRVDDYESRTASGYLDVSSGNETLVNPVSIVKRSADGKIVDRILATRGTTVTSAGELTATDSLPQSGWQSWSQDENDIFGRMEISRTYFVIPSAGPGLVHVNFTESSVERDSMNRIFKQTEVDGTISMTVFNARGLVKSQWLGTNPAGVLSTANPIDPEGGGATGNNMVMLSETEYDNGAASGNSLVTKVTTKVDSTPANDRITEMEYDWRNRLANTITTDGTNDFHQKPTLDNLGRAIETNTYRDDSGVLTLIARSESFYDDRSRMYQSKTYAVSDAGVAGNSLESNQWFDANGQVIKSSSPGSKAFTKTEYDNVGRVTAVYSAYYDGTGADVPDNLIDNIVLTESISEYDAAGNLIFSTSKDRLHDATGSGNLNGPGGSQPQSRDSYMAVWYDEIGRARSTANFGTAGGIAPTRAVSAPSSSDTVHVTETNFDIAGRVNETVDAVGAKTITEFDADGLTKKVTTNSGGAETQTIETEYTIYRQLYKQVAKNADTGDQETVHAYGVTLPDSDVASNSMLAQMTHPDSGIVSYTYDRTVQQTSMTDPNNTGHVYEYDKAGRRISDSVTLAVGSVVDDAVLRIERSYDTRMRLKNITSYDAAVAGNITSDVQYEYNDFGQVTKEFQQDGAAVNVASSPVVEYSFEDGSDNTIRQTSIVYPDGRQLDHNYGSTGGQDDLLDRVQSIDDGSTTLISYECSGLGSVVTRTYDEPGISQTIATGSGSDPYASLDRFGRVIELNWKKGAPTLVGFEYGYDRMSNREFERNLVGSGTNPETDPEMDSLFDFDSLNRMTNFQFGLLNTAGDAISNAILEQDFQLDETGNITGFEESTPNLGGSLAVSLDQTRTHNDVNEVTDISETTGTAWATPDHDANGNMNRVPQPYNLVQNFIAIWDAWNRLVKVKDGLSRVESYAYDGLNRRIEKKEYGTRGKLQKTTLFLLTSAAQVLEERVDGSTAADQQFVWGLQYVDHLVLRDCDTSNDGMLNERLYALPDLRHSVMALTDDSGSVVERFRYDAHGAAKAMDVTFVNRTASSYDWQYLYTGRREDLNTGLYFFRARYYLPQLGRFLSRDTLGFVDGMSLYRAYFIPNSVDPYGLDILDNASNFFCGWGDTLTFGATKYCRGCLGQDEYEFVNPDSGCYSAGGWTATGIECAAGAGLLKNCCKNGVKKGVKETFPSICKKKKPTPKKQPNPKRKPKTKKKCKECCLHGESKVNNHWKQCLYKCPGTPQIIWSYVPFHWYCPASVGGIVVRDPTNTVPPLYGRPGHDEGPTSYQGPPPGKPAPRC